MWQAAILDLVGEGSDMGIWIWSTIRTRVTCRLVLRSRAFCSFSFVCFGECYISKIFTFLKKKLHSLFLYFKCLEHGKKHSTRLKRCQLICYTICPFVSVTRSSHVQGSMCFLFVCLFLFNVLSNKLLPFVKVNVSNSLISLE